MSRASAALGVLVSTAALANGRAPAPISIAVPGAEPTMMLLGSTFGLVASDDGGGSWWWFCEQAIGYGGVYDPRFAVGPDGDLWAPVPLGLARSRDDGCGFERTEAPLAGLAPTDLVVAGGVIYATAAAEPSEPGRGLLLRSLDGGATFEALLETERALHGIAVSGDDPDRLYVGATEEDPDAAWLLRSDDGGQSFAEAGIDLDDIVAVRPVGAWGNAPSVVLVIADREAGSVLLRSEDGGATLDAVQESFGRLSGFAMDGAEGVFASSVADGIYRSSDGGRSFVRETSPRASGLAWRSPYLYATGTPSDGFALGRSADGALGFERVMALDEIDGPRACPTGTPEADVCAPLWPGVALSLGIDPTAARDGGATDAAPPGDSGSSIDGAEPDHAPAGGCACSLGKPL
ncbi:MAG: hypothetical protein AABZ30_07670 [Myxococcota bacterium]